MHAITTSPKTGSLILALTQLLDITPVGAPPSPATVYRVAAYHGVEQARLQAAYDRYDGSVDRACKGV